MSIQIRKLMKQDNEPILTLARELASWFNPLDQMALAIDLLHHEGFVAIEAQQVVGFVTYHLPEPQIAELSWFGVGLSKQGQGIGIRLLVALEALLLDKNVLILEVSTVPSDHNPIFTATNAFYQRSGFAIKQRDQHYYAYGRPRILLKKQLSEHATYHTLLTSPTKLTKTESETTIRSSLHSS